MKREQTERIPLFDGRGRLSAPGWARTPVWTYRRRSVPAALGLKEWERLIVSDGRSAFGFALTDNTYLGSLSVWLYDLESGTQTAAWKQTPLTLGSTGLSEDPLGSSAASGEGWAVALLREEEGTTLTLHLEGFRGGDALDARLSLAQPSGDLLATVIPFLKPDQFCYSCKRVGIPASGELAIGGETVALGPEAAAVTDWSRGVLPYKSRQTWAAAWGSAEGAPFALTLGYGLGPGLEPTENGVFVDGVLHKLDRVALRIPEGKPDPNPAWRIVSSDRRFAAEFTPGLTRTEDHNALVIRTTARQTFGHFKGSVTLDDGRKVSFRDLPGFVEQSDHRW